MAVIGRFGGRLVAARSPLLVVGLLLAMLFVPAAQATCHTSYYGCRSNLALVGGRSMTHWDGSDDILSLNAVDLEALVVSPRGNGQAFAVGEQGYALVNFTYNPTTAGAAPPPVTVTYSFEPAAGTPSVVSSTSPTSPFTLSFPEKARQQVRLDFRVDRLPDACRGDSTYAVATQTFEGRFHVTVTDAAGMPASLPTDQDYLYVPVTVGLDGPHPAVQARCNVGTTDALPVALGVAVLAVAALLARKRPA